MSFHNDGSSQNAGPGPGSGYLFFFVSFFFVSIFVVILQYCYFRMFGIVPSFMIEIKKKKKRNILKLRKGHLCLFFETKRISY